MANEYTQQEKARVWLPLIEAVANGKTIQWHKEDTDEWIDQALHDIDLCGDSPDEYRIKPTVTYRPFKDGNELVAEFCKRFGVERKTWGMPFIWVKDTQPALIASFGTDAVLRETTAHVAGRSWKDFDALFKDFTFLDGSPCGVEEEQC